MEKTMKKGNWTLVKATNDEIVFNSKEVNLTVKLLGITNTVKDDFTMEIIFNGNKPNNESFLYKVEINSTSVPELLVDMFLAEIFPKDVRLDLGKCNLDIKKRVEGGTTTYKFTYGIPSSFVLTGFLNNKTIVKYIGKEDLKIIPGLKFLGHKVHKVVFNNDNSDCNHEEIALYYKGYIYNIFNGDGNLYLDESGYRLLDEDTVDKADATIKEFLLDSGLIKDNEIYIGIPPYMTEMEYYKNLKHVELSNDVMEAYKKVFEETSNE